MRFLPARWILRSRCALRSAVALALLATSTPAAAAISSEWVQRWRDDLAFMAKTLPETHADLFHSMPRDSFETRIARLQRNLPHMEHYQITVAVAELVAGVHDGHTRLTLPVDPEAGFFSGHSSTPAPKIEGLSFHQLPIRLYLYQDGLFVRRVDRKHASVVGGRVLRIGRLPAEEAMAKVTPVVQRDNESQVRNLLPDFLVIAEVLAARGVTAGPAAASFEIETTGGKKVAIDLSAVPLGDPVDWVDARDGSKAPTPLYLRDPDSNYWFEYLKDDRIVYMQYNEVNDREDESIDAFADRMFAFIADSPVEALIIDIRNNPGGNNGRNMPLLKGLIRSAKVQEPGRLFVIAGRGTFSAAMMFAVDLEKYMNAIFVGEPTGASPNGYGDSRKVTLPNSGLTVRVSTLEWQYSDPRDDRDAIAPEIPAALTSAEYRANHDPALDAVRSIVSGPANAPSLTKKLDGAIHSGSDAYQFTLTVDEAGKRVTMSIPALELDAVPGEVLVSDREHLSFQVPLGNVAMRVDGRWMGGWLIGQVSIPGMGSALLLISAP